MSRWMQTTSLAPLTGQPFGLRGENACNDAAGFWASHRGQGKEELGCHAPAWRPQGPYPIWRTGVVGQRTIPIGPSRRSRCGAVSTVTSILLSASGRSRPSSVVAHLSCKRGNDLPRSAACSDGSAREPLDRNLVPPLRISRSTDGIKFRGNKSSSTAKISGSVKSRIADRLHLSLLSLIGAIMPSMTVLAMES